MISGPLSTFNHKDHFKKFWSPKFEHYSWKCRISQMLNESCACFTFRYITRCDTFDFDFHPEETKLVQSNFYSTVNASSAYRNLTKWTWSHPYYQVERLVPRVLHIVATGITAAVHTITKRRGVDQQRYIMDRVRPLCIPDRAAPRFCSYDVFISGAAAVAFFRDTILDLSGTTASECH